MDKEGSWNYRGAFHDTVFVISYQNPCFWLIISRFITDFCHLSLKKGFVKQVPDLNDNLYNHKFHTKSTSIQSCRARQSVLHLHCHSLCHCIYIHMSRYIKAEYYYYYVTVQYNSTCIYILHVHTHYTLPNSDTTIKRRRYGSVVEQWSLKREVPVRNQVDALLPFGKALILLPKSHLQAPKMKRLIPTAFERQY